MTKNISLQSKKSTRTWRLFFDARDNQSSEPLVSPISQKLLSNWLKKPLCHSLCSSAFFLTYFVFGTRLVSVAFSSATLNWIKREHPHFTYLWHLIVANLKYVFITHKIIYGTQWDRKTKKDDTIKSLNTEKKTKKKLSAARFHRDEQYWYKWTTIYKLYILWRCSRVDN